MPGKKPPNNSGLFGLFGNDPIPSRSPSDNAANSLRWTGDKNKNIDGLGQRIDGHDKEIGKIKREMDRIKRNTINSVNQATRDVAAKASKEVEEKHAALEADLQAKSDNIKEDVGTIRKELSSDRYRTVEVLAFFVAFFTFVSIEFQLFANITNYFQVLSLTLILFGSMVFFVVLLSRVIGLMSNQVGLGRKVLAASIVIIFIGAVLGLGSEKLGWAQSPTEKFVETKSQQCQRMMEDITAKGTESSQYNAFFALGCNEIGADQDMQKQEVRGQ